MSCARTASSGVAMRAAYHGSLPSSVDHAPSEAASVRSRARSSTRCRLRAASCSPRTRTREVGGLARTDSVAMASCIW